MVKKHGHLNYDIPVVLVGPTDVDLELLGGLIARGYAVICADGGANALLERGIVPNAVIGDFDSLDQSACKDKDITLIHLSEQYSTDFEKCLYSVDAPVFLALGFTGMRIDHTLAALHAMVKFHPEKTVLLMSGCDVSFVHRGALEMPTKLGQTVSIFPLENIEFHKSTGLEYALDGLSFNMSEQIGTSNCATKAMVGIVPAIEHLETPYLVTIPNPKDDELPDTISRFL